MVVGRDKETGKQAKPGPPTAVVPQWKAVRLNACSKRKQLVNHANFLWRVNLSFAPKGLTAAIGLGSDRVADGDGASTCVWLLIDCWWQWTYQGCYIPMVLSLVGPHHCPYCMCKASTVSSLCPGSSHMCCTYMLNSLHSCWLSQLMYSTM